MRQRAPQAHIARAADGALRAHPLIDHLEAVASLAAAFGASFGATEWARIAGLWHDLGKYRAGFQTYIRQPGGVDAHIEHRVAGKEKTHSAAGALHAIDCFKRSHGRKGELAARVLAYLIASHHAGLYDWENADGERHDLKDRLFAPAGGFAEDAKREYEQAREVAPATVLGACDSFDPIAALGALRGCDNPLGFSLALRMIFSCLVDADFLDTEQFFDPPRFAARSRVPSIDDLGAALDEFILGRDTELQADGRANTKVNRLRAKVLAQCRAKAALPPGLFSLEVPTGGGKTLSSLAFALTHARAHQKRRVIYAIPYTSIIEQTADVFRGVFGALGEGAVIEHHSQAESDPRQETAASRLACENWDAPLIVTTNVQLFESLFAARTSRCRKLHNLADSVIVLDEAQQLPPQFLQPVLDALNLLAKHYGATVVLCTATQPVLETREYFEHSRNVRGLPPATPIIDERTELFRQLKRVNVHLPEDWNARTPLPDLATALRNHECVLAIVDRKRDARELHALLPGDTFHLSSLMCGAHRADVINAIKQRLLARRAGTDSRPLLVVSTQLVEAGVDLDFPVVFRALAGLDSIAQAAGRCNREGLLATGDVFVFVPPRDAPSGLLLKAAQATRSVLHDRPAEPLTPELFRRYFEVFYADYDADQKGIVPLLTADSEFGVKFRTAAERFRLIDEDTVPVIVRYRGSKGEDETIEKLLAILVRDGPSRWLLRSLQRYLVSCRRREVEALSKRGDVAPAPGLPSFLVQQWSQGYDPVVGLRIDGAANVEDYVV